MNETIDGGFIEAVHQAAELGCGHFFGDRSRAAHVAGSSAGANVGLELARDYPHLLRTLILGEPDLSNWLLEINSAEDTETGTRALELIREAASQGDYEKAIRLFADQVLGSGAFDRLPDATQQRMLDNARLLSLPVVIHKDAQITFTRQDARSMRLPTLLLRGDSSPELFLLADEELAKNVPGAERTLIPNAVHLLHGMNPKVYYDVVLSFLAQH